MCGSGAMIASCSAISDHIQMQANTTSEFKAKFALHDATHLVPGFVLFLGVPDR